MADYPPYPPPPPPPERPAERPGAVTGAGWVLIVVGAAGVLVGFLLLLAGRVGAYYAVVGLLALGVGALEIYAGTQVLALRERGRVIGLALAGIGAVLALLAIGRRPETSIIQLALDAFIIWALVQNQAAFRP